MSVSAVTAPVAIGPVQSSPAPKPPEQTADVQNGAPADGTRAPKPTVLAALPPGQGTRVDQLV